MSANASSRLMSSPLRRWGASIIAGTFLGAAVQYVSPPSALHALSTTTMSPNEFRPFRVSHIEKVTENTRLYRFALPPGETLNMPVASLLLVRAAIGSVKEDGSRANVIRPYTPTNARSSTGHFDLVVKAYEQGKLSKHFGSLKVGDSVEMKGPITKLNYTPNMKKSIGMVAGGTGITPMLQVMREIASDKTDTTKVSLIFANQTPSDVLLEKEINQMCKDNKNFEVYYVVDRPSKSWKGGSGYVTQEMLEQKMPKPGKDSMIFVCGPPPMMAHISGNKAPDKSQGPLDGILKKMGYSEDMVYKF